MKKWIEYNVETREIVNFYFGAHPVIKEGHDAFRVPDGCEFNSSDTIDAVMKKAGANKAVVLRGINWEKL